MLNEDDGEFQTALVQSLASMRIGRLADSALQQMSLHYKLLSKWNARLNLTRIVAPQEAARLNYAESIYGYHLIKGAAALLDVGSGAGFPGVPMAIMNGGLSVTALESNQKKSIFLKEVKQQLALPNLTIETSRIEDFECSGYSVIASRALDRAEKMYGDLLGRLSPGQILMLFCSGAMVQSLSRKLPSGFDVQPHPIPNSQSRVIALFKRSPAHSS
jgi:16S rRNA (guanine527-N7)-methyltransferase